MRSPAPDYYQVLGVSPDASHQQVKDRFRELARSLHPDANPQDTAAAERFKSVTEAWDVLGDPRKRALHDQRTGLSGDSGLEHDLLSDLLDGLLGTDVVVDAQVDFLRALHGAQVQVPAPSGHWLQVDIPAGSWDGRILRAGSGADRVSIRLHVGPHPRFTLTPKGLHAQVSVRFAQAVLGDQVAVPTPSGDPVLLRVEPGTASGTVLRARGRAAPGVDLLVRVDVQVPRALSQQSRELLLAFDRSLPAAPAAGEDAR